MRFRAGRLASVVLLLTATSAFAGDLRPSWECLPEETAVLLHMPQPAEFLEAIRDRTKFGAVAMSEPRLQGFWKLLLDKFRSDGAAGELEDLDEALGRYDLRQEDLPAAFRGDVGAGFVVEQLIEPDVRPVDPTDPKNQRWGKTPPFLETFPTILIFKSRK